MLREKDLSLDKALDMCKSSEVTNKQLKSIQRDEELHLVHDKRKSRKDKKPPHLKKMLSQKKPNKSFSSKAWKCKYCGQQKKHDRQTIGGIVSKETVCCVGGKVKH